MLQIGTGVDDGKSVGHRGFANLRFSAFSASRGWPHRASRNEVANFVPRQPIEPCETNRRI